MFLSFCHSTYTWQVEHYNQMTPWGSTKLLLLYIVKYKRRRFHCKSSYQFNSNWPTSATLWSNRNKSSFHQGHDTGKCPCILFTSISSVSLVTQWCRRAPIFHWNNPQLPVVYLFFQNKKHRDHQTTPIWASCQFRTNIRVLLYLCHQTKTPELLMHSGTICIQLLILKFSYPSNNLEGKKKYNDKQPSTNRTLTKYLSHLMVD